MKSPGSYFLVFLLFVLMLPPLQVRAQNSGFDVDIYKQFLQQHQDMPASEMMNLYQAGTFKKTITGINPDALYLDSIGIKFNLTNGEKELLSKHGFVVTERLQKDSFGAQLLDIYHKDLPVFVSSDAILHAFHCSYDRILKDIELDYLIPAVTDLLELMHEQVPVLAAHYSTNPAMQTMLHDVDVYLTIPRMILDETVQPYFPANVPLIESLLQNITDLWPVQVPLFSTTLKTIDFSQFKPRGHYDDANYPQLAAYFKAMIWLCRIEIYLLPPRSADIGPTREDLQRQVIDALLLSELIDRAQAYPLYQKIESMLSFFVGDQDNVTLDNLDGLKQELNITQASVLLDTLELANFQSALSQKPFAEQKILSQILMNDPCSPDSIIPASAFMLYGQRFVIDSYVTGNVVYDRIRYQGEAVTRMLPSTLDILFSLGNDAAGQLLQSQLEQYHYTTNLSALRYLIDSYETEFWDRTLYNMWLHTIRALNPPGQRENLAPVFQTAAWWQKNMNSQLSSWTELRHDHLLYAKQSYSGGVICSYPYGFVDPVPQLFSRLKNLGLTVADKIQAFDFNNEYMKSYITSYFQNLAGVCDTLQGIAQKEIDGVVFSTVEKLFLKRMITLQQVCGEVYDGWYVGLFYQSLDDTEGFLKKDFLVADYHTAPTDEFGNMVGWVAHAGTGPVDMLILITHLPGVGNVAFTGPVLSYYEYTSLNFLRLTDNEWKESYLAQSARPAWTNLYLSDNQGKIKETGPTLLTGLDNDHTTIQPVDHIIARCYPNPFNNETLIQFALPEKLTNTRVQVSIYDLQGKVVSRLLNMNLSTGNYFVRWNGTDYAGHQVASGVYFYEIKGQQEKYIGKLQLIR